MIMGDSWSMVVNSIAPRHYDLKLFVTSYLMNYFFNNYFSY